MSRSSRPNVLWITTDQHRADALGCYGNSVVQTPNIDVLASGGVRFANCFTPSPVCAATRASLLTGRWPHIHGALSNGHAFAASELTWASVLSQWGYQTGAIGKMHFEPWDAHHGFHDRIVAESKHFAEITDDYARYLHRHGYDFNRTIGRVKVRQPDGTERNAWWLPEEQVLPLEHYIDVFIGRRACRWLRQAVGGPRPFACWVSFTSPHHPVDPPEPFRSRYADAPVPAQVASPDEPQTKPPEQQEMRFAEANDPEIRTRYWRYYYATVSLVDEQVGQILRTLRELGHLDDTLIIFTSDHGDAVGDHGLFDKASAMYDCIVRVPAIVHMPQRISPAVCDALVQSVDLTATMYELLDIPAPAGMQGRGLWDLMRQRVEKVRDYVVSEHYHMLMVRDDRHKYVHYVGKDYGELYDLKADDGELVNLFGRSSHAELQRRMLSRLVDFFVSTIDPRFSLLAEPSNIGAYPHKFAHLQRIQTGR